MNLNRAAGRRCPAAGRTVSLGDVLGVLEPPGRLPQATVVGARGQAEIGHDTVDPIVGAGPGPPGRRRGRFLTTSRTECILASRGPHL